MKLAVIFYLLITVSTWGQDLTITAITALDTEIYETSGLLFLDDRVITHNDSGGQPWLYEIDTTDGSVSRTVVVANASNIDWEELTMDELYLYICDFGNNSGTRTNLAIYKISIEDYLTTPNDTVYCDTIRFSYADQDDFTPATYTTNFDAEALIAVGDSLYIFTKNWGNYKTHIYPLSKVPGDYSIERSDELVVECLVTGAAYDEEKNELLLTGYTLVDPILVFIHDFAGAHFSEGAFMRYTAGLEGSIQIEGVAQLGNHEFLVSSEKKGSDPSMLHHVEFSNFLELSDMVTPKTSLAAIIITQAIDLSEFNLGDQVLIVDLNGRICIRSFSPEIYTADLQPGLYILFLIDETGHLILRQKLIKLN